MVKPHLMSQGGFHSRLPWRGYGLPVAAQLSARLPAGRPLTALLLAGVLSVSGAACSRGSSPANRSSEFTARPDARRFDINGKVVRVDPVLRKVALDHERVADFMDAMIMEFTVKEDWALKQMAAGDTIRATLVVDGARSWIEAPAITKGLVAATAPRGTWVPADPGTPLPDVALIDQDAKPFRLARYRGHLLLVNFSFTRCPLPEYCPLSMSQLAKVEQESAKTPALKQSLRLLTVTLDPSYDTPAILKTYGEKSVTGDGPARRFSRWSMATGETADIRKLAGFFGLDFYHESDRIIHSLRTGIIDPDGKVFKVFEGNEWTVEDMMRELRAAASPKAATAARQPAAPVPLVVPAGPSGS
jgi:protein SCO1/2